MAKENWVSLMGYCMEDPKIFINEDGEPIMAKFKLITIKRFVNTGLVNDSNVTYSEIPVQSLDPEIIKKIDKVEKGDFVDVAGVLTTRAVLKSKRCPYCKEHGIMTKNSVEGMRTTVTPLYIEVREKNVTEQKAQELLRQRNEVSNLFRCIGALVRDVDYYYNPGKKRSSNAQYQIAINRKYTIVQDGPEIRTDYPWVKTVGEQAIQDSETLAEGSVVYINGFLQSRKVKRRFICSECSGEYEWTDDVLEILPWAVEFLFKNKEDKVDIETYAEDGLANLPPEG